MHSEPVERIALPIKIEDFDPSRALRLRDLHKKCPRLFRTATRPLSLDTIRRYRNPKRGLRPLRNSGPAVVLPTMLHCGDYCVMPEWLDWFVAEVEKIQREAIRLTLPASERARLAVERINAAGRK